MAASLHTLPSGANITALLAGPAGPAPPGHVVDLNAKNPYTVAINALIAIALFNGITFTSMRLFTQHFIARGLVVEDYVMLAALVIQIGNSCLSFDILANGIGRHMWNISLEQFFIASKLTWCFVTFYYVSVTLVKVAILLQIIRIFGVNKMTRVTCWVCIVASVALYIPCVLLNIFECSPISGAWNRAQPSHCINVGALYEATGIINAFSDLVILVIPIPVVVSLKMSLKRKLLVSTVFATGILAIVASILRAIWTFKAFDSHDLSYNLLWMGVFCTFEVIFGMLIFFMPVAAVLYHYLKTKLWGPSPAAATASWERCPEDVERARPKGSHPYEMPSLASFEERETGIERRRTTTIEYMSSIDELDSHSSNKSKPTISSGGSFF